MNIHSSRTPPRPAELRRAACTLSFAAFLCCAPATAPGATPLVGGPPILVPDSKGAFDYLQVDSVQRRFLADHTGNNTLDVFDVDTGKLLKHIPTGKAQGVAVDSEAGKYFVSVSQEQRVVVIDSKSLEKTGEIKLSGPADALVLDPKNHCLYVGHDDGPAVWVIDTKTEKVVASIAIPEGPEYVIYDAEGDRKTAPGAKTIAVDPSTHAVWIGEPFLIQVFDQILAFMAGKGGIVDRPVLLI